MGLPQTTFSQRRNYYKDIESLISPGFISHRLRVNKVNLQLRSPVPSDIFYIQHMADYRKPNDWIYWSLAKTTWVVEGIPVLDDKYAIKQLYDHYRYIPNKTLQYIYHIFLGLHNRTHKAKRGVEAYVQEHISRQKWWALNNALVNSKEISGIPGSGQLGMNIIQELWTTLNVLEDLREEDDRQWRHVRASMGVHLSKQSWQKMQSDNNFQETKKNEARQETLDTFYYRSKNVLTWEENMSAAETVVQIRSKTVDDLQREMYNWTHGIKDPHDLIIDQLNDKLAKEREVFRRKRAEREAQLAAMRENMPKLGSKTIMVGFTPQQMREWLAENPQDNPNLQPIGQFENRETQHNIDKYLDSNAKINRAFEQIQRKTRTMQEDSENRRIVIEE